jgi:hypothetical protein
VKHILPVVAIVAGLVLSVLWTGSIAYALYLLF